MSLKLFLPKGPGLTDEAPSGKSFPFVFLLTRLAAIGVFTGRAWQHLRWDAPYRDLLWDEKWMGSAIRFIGYPDWQSFVTDPAADQAIQLFIQGVGGFYVLCAFAAGFIIRLGKLGRVILRIGGVSLIILAALYTKEKFFFIGQFLEYTLQWSTPFFLAGFAHASSVSNRSFFLLKIAVALTFTCHGLYAVGFYPRPEVFLTMVINILNLGNENAILFLNLAGGLDFLFSVALFLPWRSVNILAAAYLCFWGIMTTIARIWAFVHWEYLNSGLVQWVHESIYRIPHFLMPLALLIIFRHSGSGTANPKPSPS